MLFARAQNSEQARKGEIPVGIDKNLESYVRYRTAHDRALAEIQKRKKTSQLAEIGFASQKRQEAEESRKAEKHAVHIATDNFRKQREEIKLAHELAKILPDDFDLSSPTDPLPPPRAIGTWSASDGPPWAT